MVRLFLRLFSARQLPGGPQLFILACAGIATVSSVHAATLTADGGGCPPIYTQNFDSVTPPELPAGWVASQGVNVTGAPFWVTSTITPDTPPNDAFSTAPDNILDNRLDLGF